MQRYEVTNSRKNPPQYLGGVGPYDVFYWQRDYNGAPRLIIKWTNHQDAWLVWRFDRQYWENCYQQKTRHPPTDEHTATILAMYECFANRE